MIKSILIICLSFFWIIRSLKQLFCHTVSHFLFILAYPKYSTNSTNISQFDYLCHLWTILSSIILVPRIYSFHRFCHLAFLVLTNPCHLCNLWALFLPLILVPQIPRISSLGILCPTYLCHPCHLWALFLPLILVPQISQIYTDFVTWHSLS